MRFPHNTNRIIDKYGILWVYDSKSRSWIDMGYTDIYTNVTETSDGLVGPRLFEILESIDPNKFNGLKISNNNTASFYYLYSSDKTIKFEYEENLGDRFIRLEANTALISRKFSDIKCIGNKGQKGNKGSQGIHGIVAPNEYIYKLDIDDSGLVRIEVPVTVPIDTNFSLRIFRSQIQIGEFLIHNDGEVTYSFSPGYSIKEGTIYDIYIDNDVLYGNFELSGDLTGTWTFKARQTGPNGTPGKDGSWFIGINEVGIEDENLRSGIVVYDMFKDGNNILHTKSAVSGGVCAAGLIADDQAYHKFIIEPTAWPNPTRSTFLPAAKYSSSNCRDIVRWQYIRSSLSVPELKLPQWTPTECCPGERSNNV